MFKLTGLAIFFFCFQVSAQQKYLADTHEEMPCYGSQQVENWKTEFDIDLSSFPSGNYYCDNSHPLKKIFNIFQYLQDQNFESSNPLGGFEKGFVRTSYWDFVKARIAHIQYNNSTEFYYMATNDEEGNLNIYPGLFIIPLIGQVASLIHEARHFDGFHHLECKKGLYKGKLGCDLRYEDAGSYAVELEYALRVLHKGVNFSPAAKEIMAKKLIPLRRDNNFIESPTDDLLLKSF
jgi:hypothetical protein